MDENGLRWETGVAGVVYYALCPEGHVGKHQVVIPTYRCIHHAPGIERFTINLLIHGIFCRKCQ